MTRKFVIALMALSLLAFGAVAYAGSASSSGAGSSYDFSPKLSGIAYLQTHGGHVAVVDLSDGSVKRIVHGKPSDALTVSKDGKTLYMFSLDGHAKEVNLVTGKQTEWMKLGHKHCGSMVAPDGTVWVSDMKDGSIYIYDPKKKKLADVIKVSKSICGIDFSKDGKKAYASDMPGGFVSIIDVKKKKVIGKIEGVGNFIHRARVSPDGTELWQSEGNELKAGKPYGVGYAEDGGTPGGVSIVDLKSGKVKDFVITGGNPHDVSFSPDGKYALVAARQLPTRADSAIIVVDMKTKRVVKQYSACTSCHGAIGLEIPETKDGGRAFLCALDVDWNAKKFPAGCEE
ncbi:MAG: YncE family protein [Nitrospirota bacterium]|nr:MAG: YncE family protein [Nitrospirota bacterium]